MADTFGKTVIKIISETIKYEGRINRIQFYGKSKGPFIVKRKRKRRRFQMGSQKIEYNAHIKSQPRNSFFDFRLRFSTM